MFIDVVKQIVLSFDMLEGVVILSALLFLSLYIYNLSIKYFFIVGGMLSILGVALVVSTVDEYKLATACAMVIFIMMLVSIDYFLMIRLTKKRWLNHVPNSVVPNTYAGLLGKSGVAESDIGKKGEVNIKGSIYMAHSDGIIKAGSRVRVSSIEGKVLNVQLE